MLRDSGRYRRKLTPWEAGQIIIDLYDRMADNQEELDRDGHPELARVVRECANKMAEALDAHGSHKIGLGRMEK